jgi:hypothetical protein
MGRIEGEGRRIDPTAQERKHEQAPADGEPQSTSVQPQFTPPAPKAVRQATRLHALALRQSRVFLGNTNVGFPSAGENLRTRLLRDMLLSACFLPAGVVAVFHASWGKPCGKRL